METWRKTDKRFPNLFKLVQAIQVFPIRQHKLRGNSHFLVLLKSPRGI